MLAVRIFKTGAWLSYHSPNWLKYLFATIAGELYYWIARRHSRYADRNLQIVLGEPKINRRVRYMARRSFRNYAKYMVEFFGMLYITPEKVEEITETCGWEHVRQALTREKGVMLVTPHFGNWDIAATLVKEKIHTSICSVAHDFNPPELNRVVQGIRRKQGLSIFSPKDALRGLYSALKNNEIVVLLLDSPVEGDGIVIDFFGKPARFPSGPAMLVYRTGAAMMLGYVARQPGNKTFYGMWEPAIQYHHTGDREEDIRAITQAIAHEMERIIRRHPDQWYMFRKLWLDEQEIAEYQREQQRQNIRRETRKALKNGHKNGTENGVVSESEPSQTVINS